MISIVIPTLGEPALLDATLRSAAASAHVRGEVIVVGDALAAAARTSGQFDASRFVWLERRWVGRAEALDEGLSVATGDFTAMLAAGDTLFAETCRVVGELIARYPRVDVFYGDTLITDTDGRPIAEFNPPGRFDRRNRGHCRFCPPSTFIRRGAIEQAGGIDATLHHWPEHDLWLRLDAARARFRQVPRLIAARRRLPTNATSSDFTSLPSATSLDELMEVRLSRHARRLSTPLLAWYGGARAALADPAEPSLSLRKRLAMAMQHGAEAHRRWGDGRPLAPVRQLVIAARLVRRLARGAATKEFTVRAPEPLAAKRMQFFRRKIFRLMHHAPRPLHVPADYTRSAAPADPPTIAIVTPSFNQGHVLEATIRSVLDQDYPAVEYVVQDGGSTDGSVAILERYASRLFAWESAPDGGQAAAINLGLRRTSGDIMAYLNSDDILMPGALAYVASYFRAHPDVDVVYGHRVLIDGNGEEVGRWVLPPHDDRVIAFADFIPQETMFWRRRAWEAVGGGIDESFRFAMDWDLILRFRDAGMTFRRLPRFLGGFRVWQDQKGVAWWLPVGRRETERLTARTLGATPSRDRVQREIRGYLRHHWVLDKLYLAGLLRH
jgi:glycosyltransferase involved in cell wall biosynthesis